MYIKKIVGIRPNIERKYVFIDQILFSYLFICATFGDTRLP